MVMGGIAVLVSGFYGSCDELPLILALLILSQRVFCLVDVIVTGRF